MEDCRAENFGPPYWANTLYAGLPIPVSLSSIHITCLGGCRYAGRNRNARSLAFEERLTVSPPAGRLGAVRFLTVRLVNRITTFPIYPFVHGH